MKNRISKILGLGLAVVLALALVAGFAVPVAASPDENEWEKFDYPDAGEDGDWFRDADIAAVGPMAEAINGDLYTYADVTIDGVDDHLFKSEDGGRTWATTGYDEIDLDPSTATVIDPPGPIVDMVCSSIDEDIIYVTDGNYVYKSTDAGDEFAFVGRASLEEAITGTCGIDITREPITCIDVGYDDDEDPFVFIGTEETGAGTPSNGAASVLWIGEAGYPSTWTDLKLLCYGGGGYEPYSIGCAPDFADSKKTFVVVSNGDETHVVSTIGVSCGWTEFAELFQNCDDDNPFGIREASRIGFPDDWEDTETLFVSVVDDGVAPGGDVYLVTSDGAVDMNVEGIKTGCVGKEDYTNIISLDIYGDTDEASLIAGAYDDTNVYCSEDGGWSWDKCAKEPTGEERAYVIWYEDTALAATWGDECAVSMCCGEDFPCEFWNQISLIATDIDEVLYGDHSPGYVVDSETLFMLTDCDDCCRVGTQSLFRYDGTNWERVYCSTIAGADEDIAFEWVLVSPDFNTTNAVFVANTGFEIWRSLDAGCSWKKMTFPCRTRPTIFSGVVIDEDTGITGGEATVYKTERHGARPWDDYEVTGAGNIMSFDLVPGYDDPDTILLGDDDSQVFISEDGGEEWELVGDCQDVLQGTTYWTSVVFDPAYATTGIIYAAAGDVIARCIIDPDEDMADQEWDEIYTSADDEYWGIVAAGDTALYVTDTATVEDVTDPEDDVMDNGGVLRSLNPDAEDPDDVVFERLTEGLVEEETALLGLQLTTGSNVLWSLDSEVKTNVWTYEDTLATPVLLSTPVEGQKLPTATKATLSWEELDEATLYEVSLYRYCPECPELKEEIAVADTEETCITVEDLDTGTLYYWQVRVALGSPTLSKWSEERTFITALLAVPYLCSPVCGGQDIILTPNFSWDAVEGATGYDIELATTETFTAGVVSGSSIVNAWVTEPLDYATTYYWRVRAEKDGVFSDWSVCIFTTMEEPVEPPPPVEITPAPPAPTIEIPPAQMITPNWIYAVIGIGAALCVVVIVLIVRTRRPPA